MSYAKIFKRQYPFWKEYSRFLVKFIFSIILIVTLLWSGFYYTFVALILLFFLGSLFSLIFKNKKNWLTTTIKHIEKEYEKGFYGKEALLSLLGFISVFLIVWLSYYLITFPLEWSIISGLVMMGIGNNLASIILYFKKKQHVVYGTTIEFFILAFLLNSTLLWFIGFPLNYAIYLSIGVQIFLILPWLDINFSTLLISALLYIILYL